MISSHNNEIPTTKLHTPYILYIPSTKYHEKRLVDNAKGTQNQAKWSSVKINQASCDNILLGGN